MEQSKKIYTLGKIKQLIDLNGDSTNFDLSFKVTCADDTHFHVLVVDQETLDNNQELEYKNHLNILYELKNLSTRKLKKQYLVILLLIKIFFIKTIF